MTNPGPKPTPYTATSQQHRTRKLPGWRAEALRTTFWLMPCVLIVAAVVLFACTLAIDIAAYHHHLTLPSWIASEGASASREVLIATAAAIITVVGVVFSITILALTLASQQFGPRMMRTFMRDFGNQMTLAVFVGSFVYALITLAFIAGHFVPHLSITVSEALLLVDLGVLIYFIHHIATSIQLPAVMARIADDLMVAIDTEFPQTDPHSEPEPVAATGRTLPELIDALERGAPVSTSKSGYLQFVGYGQLVQVARVHDAVIKLSHRPGHFVTAGRPIAVVWPAGAAGQVRDALSRAHLTGPHRTLNQDPVFAIDQLVEIAIRALSPAVNDTFTALTCIDWLSAGLSLVSGRTMAGGVYRDELGQIRLIESTPSYGRMVNRAFDKVRQSSRGMPAVIIRLLDSLTHISEFTTEDAQRRVLLRQGEMILRAAALDVTEANDLDDIRARFDSLAATCRRMDGDTSARPQPAI